MQKITSIVIITSPFGCIPPHAIGAVEKLWKSCGDVFRKKGIKVTFISKKPEIHDELPSDNIYIKGYNRTGKWWLDFVLDFVYSLYALTISPKADAIVLNTAWTPVILPLFKWKYKVSLYNVARFPKKQFKFYKAVDILSYVSNIVYKSLIEQTESSQRQACVISNFIDTDVYKKSIEHNIKETPIILYTGRIHREKGIDLLVRAVNSVNRKHKVRLKLVGAYETSKGGSGKEYKEELDKMADGWTIEWHDPIYNPKDLAKEMDKCDIYCYPSLADKGETFGVAPLEAMGLGLPTIVSSLDCFSDFLKDKENGLVFNHHSKYAVEELTNCINKIIESPELYKHLSENAVKSSTSFNVESKAEEYLTALTNMMCYRRTGFDIHELKIKKILK